MTDPGAAKGGHAPRRRVRRRQHTASEQSPAAETSVGPKPRDSVKSSKSADRGLRGLVGAGPSQLSVSAALRARDASRPDIEDVAAAERDVVVVRRHYVPPRNGPGEGRTSEAS